MVHIMVCHLFGAKPLSKPILSYCQLRPQKQTSVKFNQNIKLAIHENASENVVCELAVILPGEDELRHVAESCDN